MRIATPYNALLPEVRLFHTWEKYNRWIERQGERPVEPHETDGNMTYIDGRAAILICTDWGCWHEEAALLVHEAYHAVSEHFRAIGETAPGGEVMAYSVQMLSVELFVAHERWKRKHGMLE